MWNSRQIRVMGRLRRSSSLWMLYDWYKTDTTYSGSRADFIARRRDRSRFRKAQDLKAGSKLKWLLQRLLPPAPIQKVSLLARARPRPCLGAGRRHRAGGRIHRLEFLRRQGRHACRPDRLLVGRTALYLGRHDRLGGDFDGGGGRRSICPGQAHRRAAHGLQRGALPGLRLHDARSVRRHSGRRLDHASGDRRGLWRLAYHNPFIVLCIVVLAASTIAAC